MPPTTLDAVVLENLVSAAVAAPSIHNTQPWRYRLDPATSTLEVRAAAGRGLRHTDPVGRALHISVGAAVFNLRVAVAHTGWEPSVRLLPRPGEPDLLASVRPVRTGASDPRHRPDLYAALWRRHSSRFPFSPHRPPEELLRELAAAARAEGASLWFPGARDTTRMMRLTAAAERRNTETDARRAENRSWMREGAHDGLPGAALGARDATGRLPLRDFSGVGAAGALTARFETGPTIAVLATARDRRADWLRAGQALEHVLLVATAHSVRTSLLHQALEWPDLRTSLQRVTEGPRYVQMLIRLGYGPEGPATPRRPVREVLETGA
ncbi:Acg family FMN-binding oxidoreductase [Streptomyces mangrovi]|uniref:Acg family FMN-binding oxidoreductase n=1 Tax=Streptomyces mangrovi TaxID=1206892 RepID=UPI00399D3DBA